MDEACMQLTRDWLTKALHDLQTARIIANAVEGPLDTAIYHCQQSAEKAMKGWLVANGIAFEKTHDVRRLVRQAENLAPEFSQFAEAAEWLTPYASAYRYPGLAGEDLPLREEFDEALSHAQAIYGFVVGCLHVNQHLKAL